MKRRLEITTGLAFFIATLAYATGNNLLSHAITNMLEMSTLILGTTLELVNTLAVIVIGFCIYKLLKPYNSNLARGYYLSRIAEGLILAFGAIYVFLPANQVAQELIEMRQYAFYGGMFVLGAYSTYFFLKLLATSFWPKWLNLLGLLGYIGLFIYAAAGLSMKVDWFWLFIPGALFEIIFPIYIIAKGTKAPQDV